MPALEVYHGPRASVAGAGVAVGGTGVGKTGVGGMGVGAIVGAWVGAGAGVDVGAWVGGIGVAVAAVVGAGGLVGAGAVGATVGEVAGDDVTAGALAVVVVVLDELTAVAAALGLESPPHATARRTIAARACAEAMKTPGKRARSPDLA